MTNAYYHGVYSKFDLNGDNWKAPMTDICNQGILSRRLRGVSEETAEDIVKFNGLDYISVCERLELSATEHLNNWTAYHCYVYECIGIVVSRNIDVIVPIVLDRCKYPKYEMMANPNQHYCWMLDDRHVKNQIKPKDFIGLYYPYESYLSRYAFYENESTLRDAKENLEFLRELLISCKLDIPIIDSSRDEYIRDLTPVLTKKRSKDELRRIYIDRSNGNFF